LRRGLSDDAIERFRREVKLTRRIVHRNVARMFDIGEHAGDKFLTMELVDGESLARLAGGARLPWPRLQAIATQLCAGLEAAHAAGVVHRDLKPDNVLLEHGSDRAVITDFGIARSGDDIGVTQIGAVVGTPRYMSPEQLAGRDVDARSDLFSLGVMMFELATGTRPWAGDSAIAIAVAQATSEAGVVDTTSGDIPAAFGAIVAACLQLEPARRPASAELIGAAIANGSSDGLDAAPSTRALRPPRATTPPPARTAERTPAREPATLAVLPFTCAPDDEYLADGLAEDITDTLSTTPGLRVRPAGVARGAPVDARELGAQLGVGHVLAASLRRTPSGLRVSARLTAVADGFQTWADKAELAEGQVFAVSERIASGAAAALSAHAVAQTRPTDPRAVELYLRARAEQRRYWGNHAQAAADLLDRAAELAPTSAAILGALAHARVQAWVMRQRPELAPSAQAAIERALATGHPEAYLASAQYGFNTGSFEQGARDLGIALVRAPMLAPAHELAAHILIEIEGESARPHYETAAGLDPTRAHLQETGLARLEALQGDFANAERRAALLCSHPDPSIQIMGHVHRARFMRWRGELDGLRDELKLFDLRMGPFAQTTVRLLIEALDRGTIDVTGWRAEWLERSRTVGVPVRQQLMGAQLVVEALLLTNQIDEAITTITDAAELGLMDIMWIDHCPALRALAADARFVPIRYAVDSRAARVRATLAASQA
jgi:serine/threonine-protein kinase